MTEERKEKEKRWRKQETKTWFIRIVKDSGIPEAMEAAAKKARETETEYIKNAIITRLKKEGFSVGDFSPNLNKARHKTKIERLKKYIEEEEKKMK